MNERRYNTEMIESRLHLNTETKGRTQGTGLPCCRPFLLPCSSSWQSGGVKYRVSGYSRKCLDLGCSRVMDEVSSCLSRYGFKPHQGNSTGRSSVGELRSTAVRVSVNSGLMTKPRKRHKAVQIPSTRLYNWFRCIALALRSESPVTGQKVA